jgi:hypothetical protein
MKNNKFIYIVVAILIIIILILLGIILNIKNQEVLDKQEDVTTSQLTEASSSNSYITTQEHLTELSKASSSITTLNYCTSGAISTGDHTIVLPTKPSTVIIVTSDWNLVHQSYGGAVVYDVVEDKVLAPKSCQGAWVVSYDSETNTLNYHNDQGSEVYIWYI